MLLAGDEIHCWMCAEAAWVTARTPVGDATWGIARRGSSVFMTGPSGAEVEFVGTDCCICTATRVINALHTDLRNIDRGEGKGTLLERLMMVQELKAAEMELAIVTSLGRVN